VWWWIDGELDGPSRSAGSLVMHMLTLYLAFKLWTPGWFPILTDDTLIRNLYSSRIICKMFYRHENSLYQLSTSLITPRYKVAVQLI